MADRASPKTLPRLKQSRGAAGSTSRCCGRWHMINEEQRSRFVDKVKRALGPLAGKRIGVLGLAFKEDTDDVRESPAIAIVRELVRQGALAVRATIRRR